MARILSLKVVGVHHLNKNGSNRRFETMLCSPGEAIYLRPEPKNPADPQAVAVFSSRGIQIGYLSAERAPWIGGIINSGRDVIAIFQHEATWGAVIRVGIDGAKPELPTIRPATDDQDIDFWPDYIPPDE